MMLAPDGLIQHGKPIPLSFLTSARRLLPLSRRIGAPEFIVPSKRLFARTPDPSFYTGFDPTCVTSSTDMAILFYPGVETNPTESEGGRSQSPPAPDLAIPKNRSTGNLFANAPKSLEKARIRFSDAGLTAAEYDTMSRFVI